MVTAEQMDAAWFNAMLAQHGYRDVPVVGVQRRQIGTGQIGKCYRYQLEFAESVDDLPTSFVGKFPSDSEISRATGVQLRNYYREVNFYQQFADRVAISIPRCFHAEIEGEGPDFVLLLEDMAPAEQGDQLLGCSAEVARAAVLELVGLQAPTWCDEQLRDYDYLWSEPDPAMNPAELYRQVLPGFLDRYGHALSKDEQVIIAQVGESPQCPLFQPPTTPFCLEHVDYRLDNMLIDQRSSPPKITVVDWQSVKLGKPMNDVAYFLGAGLVPETRRAVEQGIVQEFHQRLVEAGVDDYRWEDCWTDYRKGSFSGFGVTVIASMIVEETERGNEMFITMAQRHARHALDLGAQEFFG